MDEKKYVIEVSHVNKNFKDNNCLLYTSDAADD